MSGRRSAPWIALTMTATLLVVGLAPATSMAPRVSAVDTTPDPSASPDPGPTPTVTPDPTPTPTPDPTPDPTLDPTPDPTLDPTATPAPDPTASPDPGGDATPAATDPAPDPSVAPSGAPAPGASATPSAPPSTAPTPAPTTSPPAGLSVTGTWIDRMTVSGGIDHRGAADTPVGAMDRFVVYVVRFQVDNLSDHDLRLIPTLQAGDGNQPDSWRSVPAARPEPGQPFYGATDDGRTFRARLAPIAAADLRASTGPDGTGTAVDGVISYGLNPAPGVTLPPGGYTEVAFAVRATIDAAWQATYAFRLEPGSDTVQSGSPAVVTLRAKPPVVLTMPASTTRSGPTAAGPSAAFALARPAQAGTLYPLVAQADPTSPHIEASLADDGCAACHSAHRASGGSLLSGAYRTNPLMGALEPYAGADFALCITCHDEAPFADTSGSPSSLTGFAGHGFHLGAAAENGTGGLDIETPGDGQGNALCAECHYNIHGVPSSQRGLVTFAPDVLPFNGTIAYDQASGSCTLTCHGKPHDGLTFQAAPGG